MRSCNRLVAGATLTMALIAGMGSKAAEGVTVKQLDDGGWLVSGVNYQMKVTKQGGTPSLKVAEKEFLSTKPFPGTYFCHEKEGVLKLGDAKLGKDGASFGAECDKASIQLVFKADGAMLAVKNNMQSPLHFYTLIDPSSAKALNEKGEAVNLPAEKIPVRKTRIFKVDAFVEVSGIDALWGPWNDNEVMDVSLKAGEARVVELKFGKGAPPAVGVKMDVKDGGKAGSDKFQGQDVVHAFSDSSSTPPQIPLCMIGDSITWAMEGDCWRSLLIKKLPRLAFVGTHTAKFGFSHAGEGGNSTGQVVGRLDAIPDCPYYSVLIGTNDNSIKDENLVAERAGQTAGNIEKIVNGLLAKKGVRKVFLGSILPCDSDNPQASPANPLRDKTNAATNEILRKKFEAGVFPKDKVVWVEYEKPIRSLDNWKTTIRLHPTPDGYVVLADILSGAIAKELDIKDAAAEPVPAAGKGVLIENLFDKAAGQTKCPVVAGWYTVSFDVKEVRGDKPSVTVQSASPTIATPFTNEHALQPADAGKRVEYEIFTNYEGYGYTRDRLKLTPKDCVVDKILIEKRRPSGKASTYGDGVYLDTQSKPSLGELVE